MMESRALRADSGPDFFAKISPEGRKNAGSQPSHLMHPVTQVHILNNS